MPKGLRSYPLFILRNAPRMFAHTFRGSTWRSALGLEDSRTVFARYKAIRRAERDYLGTGAAPADALVATAQPM
jgi:hypothetical protein